MAEVVIAYTTNENFVKYLCASVTSLIRHSSKQNTYRIIVLNEDISESAKELIRSTGCGYDNVAFEFVNAKAAVPQDIYTGYLCPVTYYRFTLVDLFPNIDKILYLDCDTIILTDVAELFKTDITGYYFAGVRDLISFNCFMTELPKSKYLNEVLKINNPAYYVNAGVLLFNCAYLRKDFTSKNLIDMAMSYNYKFMDQDVINAIAQGKIYYLDFRWNFFGCVKPHEFVTESDRNQYAAASKNIAIIHYIIGKPWNEINRDYNSYFWKYALDSVVADDIWNDFRKYVDNQINDLWLNEVRVFDAIYAGKIDFKFYLRLTKAALIGNLKKIKRLLKKGK